MLVTMRKEMRKGLEELKGQTRGIREEMKKIKEDIKKGEENWAKERKEERKRNIVVRGVKMAEGKVREGVESILKEIGVRVEIVSARKMQRGGRGRVEE